MKSTVVAAIAAVCAATANAYTDYTWNSNVAEGNWSEPTNWLVNGATATSYPKKNGTSGDQASFSAGTTARVIFTEANTIGRLDLSAANLNITFAQGGSSTNETQLTADRTGHYGIGGSITFDGVAFRDNFGSKATSGSDQQTAIGSGREIILKNGANVYLAARWVNASDTGKFTISGGSFLSMYAYWCGSDVEIDDSTLESRYSMMFFFSKTIRFVGKNPRLVCGGWLSYNSGLTYSQSFEFVIPEGGYEVAPVTCPTVLYSMGQYGGKTTGGTMMMNVSADSPAVLAGGNLTTKLIEWSSKGIDLNNVKEGTLPKGSDSFIWQDASGAETTATFPISLSVKLASSFAPIWDATGGDTIRATGTLPGASSATYSVKILVGTEEDNLDRSFDFGTMAGGSQYDLTAFEKDVTSARYIQPGTKYYVSLETTPAAGGDATRSEVVSVTTTGGAATFASSGATVKRNKATFTGSLSAVGLADESEVTLWIGETADPAQMTPVATNVVKTSDASYAFTVSSYELRDFEKAYWWQFRAANASAGGTTNTLSATTPAKLVTKDVTTYTWTGLGDGWTDPNNWTPSPSDCLGYPNSENASVVFKAATTNVIKLTAARTIASLDLSANNVSVTFTQGGDGTNETKLTVGELNLGNGSTASASACGKNSSLTLDGVALEKTAATQTELGKDFVLCLTNGANFCVSTTDTAKYFRNFSGGQIRLYGDSYMSVPSLSHQLETDATNYVTMIVNDSTFETITTWIQNRATVRFEGTHPVFRMKSSTSMARADNGTCGFEFVIPVGGYAAAPFQGPGASATSVYPYDGRVVSVYIDIAADSPALKGRLGGGETPLMDWGPSFGFKKSVFKDGTMPEKGVELVWSDDAYVAGGVTYPCRLGAKIGKGKGMILIIR